MESVEDSSIFYNTSDLYLWYISVSDENMKKNIKSMEKQFKSLETDLKSIKKSVGDKDKFSDVMNISFTVNTITSLW